MYLTANPSACHLACLPAYVRLRLQHRAAVLERKFSWVSHKVWRGQKFPSPFATDAPRSRPRNDATRRTQHSTPALLLSGIFTQADWMLCASCLSWADSWHGMVYLQNWVVPHTALSHTAATVVALWRLHLAPSGILCTLTHPWMDPLKRSKSRENYVSTGFSWIEKCKSISVHSSI